MTIRSRSLAACSAVLLVLGLATAAEADFRTRSIRLVPLSEWDPSPTPIRLSIDVTAEMDGAEEFSSRMEEHVLTAFEKLGYSVSDTAPTAVRITIDAFDKGAWVKRYLKGDGIVLGTIEVTSGAETVGRYRYSSRLRGGIAATSVNQMAREVGPPLVLKLTNGERDEALHGEE